MGITKLVLDIKCCIQAPYWLTYDFPPDVREKLKRQWGSDWKGQAQKWWVHLILLLVPVCTLCTLCKPMINFNFRLHSLLVHIALC